MPTRTNAHPAEQCSGTVHLKRAGMSAKSLFLHFIISLLCRWLEETIKAAALKGCLCCVLSNAWIRKHMFLNGLRAFREGIMFQSQDHFNRNNHGILWWLITEIYFSQNGIEDVVKYDINMNNKGIVAAWIKSFIYIYTFYIYCM